MANTYSQIYMHVVFAVKGRKNAISKSWTEELYKYITGVVTNKNQKLMSVNGMPDHIHLLLSINPDCKLSDLVRDIKANSSRWVNEKRFSKLKFAWQHGFGAFSVSKSQVSKVAKYIENQEEHHSKKTFIQEYIEFLRLYEVEFSEKYLFDEN